MTLTCADGRGLVRIRVHKSYALKCSQIVTQGGMSRMAAERLSRQLSFVSTPELKSPPPVTTGDPVDERLRESFDGT